MSTVFNKAWARPQSMNIWNVDNTSDLDKPVSTATQVAIDAQIGANKLDTANPVANGPLIINAGLQEPVVIVNASGGVSSSLTLQSNNKVDPNDGVVFLSSGAGAGNRAVFSTKGGIDFADGPSGLKYYSCGIGGDMLPFWNFQDTKSQINAQPIPNVLRPPDSPAFNYDCSGQSSVVIVENATTTVDVTLINPFQGKTIKFIVSNNTANAVKIIADTGDIIFIGSSGGIADYIIPRTGSIFTCVETTALAGDFAWYIVDME